MDNVNLNYWKKLGCIDPPDGKRTIIDVTTPPIMPLEYDKSDDDGSGKEEEQQQQQPPFQILGQTTLLLERDVKYGTKKRKGKCIPPELNLS
mmetsp:Transcript_20243/g.38176  ORF Transcript_20243/g.38176 Transcript_20243/m.38176 type:complete len:92 (+) Transcript_20243:1079-1354(+)|eukprot:CAMPEP_0201609856 /NCGR_PEP_ID=MMETSP0492-20130828/14982_1 /ASSEMBLY_ACC=CAM_ASM_000837 /TAXON_ID=420259 /ORGANISM="Thalassiosira gravida, Strain GMp14c1" /LENGTH=91 /DNA_ID=CAMNT_0048075465 /DNA_START=703 /DNA_END=978 /DNA_ORIENTATION=-